MHETVPAPLLEVAAEREFPVFEVPYEVPFIAVTEAAFTQLVNEQYAVLRRALAAQERLERIVLSERGLDALVGALATLIGAAVVVFDARGEPLEQHAFRRAIEPEALETVRSEVRERARRREAQGVHAVAVRREPGSGAAGGRRRRAPPGATGLGRAPEAWLVAIKDVGPLSDFDRLTLHQAVTIVALELLRARVAGDTERRLAGDVLDAIVRGELTGPELARAARAVRPVRAGGGDRAAALGRRSRPGDVRSRPRCGPHFATRRTPALVASVGQLACALVPGGDEDELFALGDRVAAAAEAELHGDVRVGIGRAVPAVDARRSFHEARCALEALALGAVAAENGNGAGPAPGERSRVATYKDLGSFQLLLSLQDDEALRLFCDSILGPIEASEGPYGGELMRSLEAFIEENGQWERAARRLYCHRHTLRYRIRRVEELTGRNLSLRARPDRVLAGAARSAAGGLRASRGRMR